MAEIPVPDAKNIDWEDIAIDDEGRLYVGDIGNNFGMFPARFIYVIQEPDPYAVPVKPAKVVQRHTYVFPEKRFDAEALVVRDGQMYVLPRQRSGPTIIYRLTPTKSGKFHPEEVATLAVRDVAGAGHLGRRTAAGTGHAPPASGCSLSVRMGSGCPTKRRSRSATRLNLSRLAVSRARTWCWRRSAAASSGCQPKTWLTARGFNGLDPAARNRGIGPSVPPPPQRDGLSSCWALTYDVQPWRWLTCKAAGVCAPGVYFLGVVGAAAS